MRDYLAWFTGKLSGRLANVSAALGRNMHTRHVTRCYLKLFRQEFCSITLTRILVSFLHLFCIKGMLYHHYRKTRNHSFFTSLMSQEDFALCKGIYPCDDIIHR
jgi:hypothetical protein